MKLSAKLWSPRLLSATFKVLAEYELRVNSAPGNSEERQKIAKLDPLAILVDGMLLEFEN